jgi:hypothetical protein
MGYVLEISDMAGYGAGAGPENWTAVTGLLEFEVTRSGVARCGTFEGVYVAPDVPSCGKPASARQRFRLRDTSATPVQNLDIIIVGRLDDVEPQENAQFGRCYRVRGRDYLGSLADNHIDAGFENAVDFGLCLGVGTVPWLANWASYPGGYASPGGVSYGLGEKRSNIITQLALNILEWGQGILWVAHPYGWIQSKPVEVNYTDMTGLTILDAIRNLSREDPWGIGIPSYPTVDAYDIVMGVDVYPPVGPPVHTMFPDAGIGGEFQIDYYSTGFSPLICGPANQRAGHQAMYYRRGEELWDPGIILQYGTLQIAGGKVATIPILSYSLPELGSDIFSRSRVLGTGEAKYVPPAPAGSSGTGNVLQSAEDTWDPVSGLYASRREIIDYDESLVGDWTHEFLPTSDSYVSRELRDRAYASLYTGNTALSRYRGAMAGEVVVPYFLRNLAGFPLVPGQLVTIQINHLGITAKSFVVDSWKYSWPANKMTLQLSRNPLRSFGEQIVKGVRRQEQLIAGMVNCWDSGWWQTDGTGSRRFDHNRAVLPKEIVVMVATASGNVDALGRPVPVLGTEVALPMTLGFDAASGQYFGWYGSESNNRYVTVRYNSNLAYNDTGGWYADGVSLMRVLVK